MSVISDTTMAGLGTTEAQCKITSLPSVIDLEHFIESFRARLSNQVPSLWPPVARLAKVFDFWRVFISISGHYWDTGGTLVDRDLH